MNKDELIQKIQGEWDNLQEVLDGLTEEQLHRPGVVGEWTIKDILAHITAWQTRLITAMFKAEKGFTPDTTEAGKTVDQMNEKFYQGLDPDLQQILVQAGKEASDVAWKESAKMTSELLAKLKGLGMQVTEVDPNEVRNAVKVVWDTWAGRVGPEGKKLIEQIAAMK